MASKSYSDLDDSYSDYSDEFDDSRAASPAHKSKYAPGNKRKVSLTQTDTDDDDEDSTSFDSRPTITKDNVKKTYKKPSKTSWKGASATSSMKRKTSNLKADSLHSRMYSAQRNRINTLNNELGEAKIKLEQLSKENRLLRTLQHRQEKSLKKFQDVEGDLPRMISQHMEDIRILRARLRKSQDAERATETKLKESYEEIHKMESTLRRLKKIVYEKNLGERSELAKQLATTEDKLFNEEKNNKDLEKKLHLTTQSYSRQLRSEQIKHKQCKQELQELKDRCSNVELRLKEKERALDVSNIYSHRSKNSPDKTSTSNRFSITAKNSPRRIETHAPLALEEAEKPLDVTDLYEEKPSSAVLEATGDVTDYRKTVKSPVVKPPSGKERRKNSALFDLSRNKAEKVESTTSNDTHQPEPEKDPLRQSRSVFLTSNYSPNTTFISDRAEPPSTIDQKPPSPLPRTPEQTIEEPVAVKVKTEKELEEERKKLDEERRKKADLLAKMKDLESEEETPSYKSSRKSGGDDLLSFLNKDTKPAKKSLFQSEKNPKDREAESYNDEPLSRRRLSRKTSVQSNFDEIDNLHRGIPSTSDLKSSNEDDEPEISFGSYAPSVAMPTKRKPHNSVKKKPSPSESDSDEPLLDLESGKQKKNDFLQQLFGNESANSSSLNPSSNNDTPFSSSRNSNAAKTTPRAKPIHSGYPWEKNVMAASPRNGDALSPLKRRNDIKGAPAVKALSSFVEDDVEELTL